MPPPPFQIAAFVALEIRALIRMRRGCGKREILVAEVLLELLLNRPAAGRVVKRRGERHAGAIAQRKQVLDKTLAKAGLAEDGGPIVILQRSGDDLGGARALLVKENGERKCVGMRGIGNTLDRLRYLAPVDGQDALFGLEEKRGCVPARPSQGHRDSYGGRE